MTDDTHDALDALRAADVLAGRRGVLLVDVDGPLYPWDNKPVRRPEGFLSYRLTLGGRWYSGSDFRRHKGLRVWLNPDHGRQILALADEADLQPVWASSWLDDANKYISPTLGLPAFPTITYPDTDLALHDNERKWRKGGRWKWPTVAQFARNIPLAWWDDDFADPCFAAAKQEFLTARTGTPTLLCDVSPRTGLRPEHFQAVRAWAAGLPDRDNTMFTAEAKGA
jgi:hypothetical protein